MKSFVETVRDVDTEAFRSLKASGVRDLLNLSIICETIRDDESAIFGHIQAELRKRVRSEARHAAH